MLTITIEDIYIIIFLGIFVYAIVALIEASTHLLRTKTSSKYYLDKKSVKFKIEKNKSYPLEK